jgi:hypothetical protein
MTEAEIVDEAEIVALRESFERAKKRDQDQEIKKAQSGLRWGLISLLIGSGLWFLSYSGWLPQVFVSISAEELRVSSIVFAGLGLVVVVLNFLSLRADRLGTERAKRQFKAAMIVFLALVLIGTCLVALSLAYLAASAVFGLPEPNFLVNGGGVGLFMMFLGWCLYLRNRGNAKRLRTLEAEVEQASEQARATVDDEKAWAFVGDRMARVRQARIQTTRAWERAWRWPGCAAIALFLASFLLIYLSHIIPELDSVWFRRMELVMFAASIASFALMLILPVVLSVVLLLAEGPGWWKAET